MVTAHDFFAAQSVKDADVFLLRLVLHDWGTSSAVKILRQLREAAVVGKTKLVLIEQVVKYACKSLDVPGDIKLPTASPVPEFLLPNARIISYTGV